MKDYVTKRENGRIQDWVNQFQISEGRKYIVRLGKFKAVYSLYFANKTIDVVMHTIIWKL